MNKEYARVEYRERTGRLTIGVQLNHNAFHVVEVLHGQVSAWAEVPYPPGMTLDSPDFPACLRRALESFEPDRRDARIWALGTLPSLQLRFLSVPRARPSQLSNVVYWTFRKEIPFDAALTVFDYDAEGEETQGPVHRVDVTAYTVLQSDITVITKLFEQAGCRLDGLVIPHFVLRNLFHARWINHQETVLALYVGEESSSVQIVKNGRVVLSRVFITGMNTILDAVRDRNPEWSPMQAFERLRNPVSEEEEVALQSVTHGALGRLMQQVERSMAAYLVGRDTEDITGIHVTGALAALPQLVEYMGRQCGIPARPTHVLDTEHMAPGVEPPSDPRESALLTMAAGVALSCPSHTPSLLHTYVKRAREFRVRKLRTAVTACAAALLLLLIGGYAAAVKVNEGKTRELAVLRQQVAQYEPALSRDMISALLLEMQDDHTRLKTVARNCRPLAVIHQLASLTPPDVRFASLGVFLESVLDVERVPVGPRERVQVAGMVRGLPEAQESKLASYVILLEDADLFERVNVLKTAPGREVAEAVLLFDMELHLSDIHGRPSPGAVTIAKETP